jgi:hypothetical protein
MVNWCNLFVGSIRHVNGLFVTFRLVGLVIMLGQWAVQQIFCPSPPNFVLYIDLDQSTEARTRLDLDVASESEASQCSKRKPPLS